MKGHVFSHFLFSLCAMTCLDKCEMAFLDMQTDDLMEFVQNTNRRLHDMEMSNMKLEKQLSFSNAQIEELVIANVQLNEQAVRDRLKIIEIETANKEMKGKLLGKLSKQNLNTNEHKRINDETEPKYQCKYPSTWDSNLNIFMTIPSPLYQSSIWETELS